MKRTPMTASNTHENTMLLRAIHESIENILEVLTSIEERTEKAKDSEASPPKRPAKDAEPYISPVALSPHPWLDMMIEMEGKHEIDDNVELSQFLGKDPEEWPWCAGMVAACLSKCGKPTAGWRARDYANYGERGTGKVGDIAVWRSHLGVVASDTEIIGGNVSNAVKRSPHPNTGKDWFSNFIGFRKVI